MEIVCSRLIDGWSVKLLSGSVIEIWADSFSEADGRHVFSLLVDATAKEQESLWIEGTTPSNPDRVAITVASIPSSEISAVRTRGEAW
jgi:hypothetical protein